MPVVRIVYCPKWRSQLYCCTLWEVGPFHSACFMDLRFIGRSEKERQHVVLSWALLSSQSFHCMLLLNFMTTCFLFLENVLLFCVYTSAHIETAGVRYSRRRNMTFTQKRPLYKNKMMMSNANYFHCIKHYLETLIVVAVWCVYVGQGKILGFLGFQLAKDESLMNSIFNLT